MSTSTTPSADPRPPRLTFGVEFEFVVPWLFAGQEDPLKDVKGLPPVFTVEDLSTESFRVWPLIRKEIENLLETHGFPVTTAGYKFKTDFDENHLKRYSRWAVTFDSSVVEPTHNPPYDFIRKFRWSGVEVKSPAEPATPASFEAINQARQLLMSRYRVRVNETCGLHVHVGNGTERFPHASMQRIASLVWASEHLLLNLNHPHRRVNDYSPPLRTGSNLAKGKFNREDEDPLSRYEKSSGKQGVADYVAGGVRHGEEPISWREGNLSDIQNIEDFLYTREEDQYEPYQGVDPRPSRVASTDNHKVNMDDEISMRILEAAATANNPFRKPARTRNIPRMVNPRYTIEQLMEFSEKLTGIRAGRRQWEDLAEDPGVFEGVNRIFQTSHSGEIAYLLDTDFRANINFVNYRLGRWDRFQYDARTIEFRGAEGTLGPWAVTWAKICVGLVRFAVHAPMEELIDVITKCDISTREDGKYDAIDFIDDLGLFAEAVAAERRIEENKEEWGIEYVQMEQ